MQLLSNDMKDRKRERKKEKGGTREEGGKGRQINR